MTKNTIPINRILLAVLELVIAIVAVLVLSRPATNTVSMDSILPAIGSSPVYVEMEDGSELVRSYTPSQDMHISGIEMILVNTSVTEANGKGSLCIALASGSGDILSDSTIDMDNVPIGEWVSVGLDAYLEAGEEYVLSFLPKGCNPYFMQVSGYSMDISVGFDYITNEVMTYGDIFYYSIPLIILIAMAGILMTLFGYAACATAVRKIDILGFFAISFGNEAFLIILFITLSLNIYSTAYVKGVYITADSDGYMREAVNLVAGNGFSYDGLAGYTTWFANWPIIYPAMIAGIMIITGANAYLASKYVAIVIIALIELVLYLAFKKKAWIYSLALTNLGFLALNYNTWSEVPFIFFMLIFGIMLGKILSEERPPWATYLAFGLAGTATFLTRYFGIYVWFVAGLYWLLLLLRKDRDVRKLVALAFTAGISGAISLLYLVINKINNGNPTGVSRGTWWDDYHTLTDNLIGSLVTEIFNVFSIEVPKVISELSPMLQVWFILFVTVAVGALIHKCLLTIGADKNILKRYLNTESVFIVMGLMYYAMFIVIRYRSSMDTFYFRFFEPATFLLTIGIIGLIIKSIDYTQTTAARDEKVGGNVIATKKNNGIAWFATFVTVMTLASLINICQSTDWSHENDYYDITTAGWNQTYKGIPERSVVIWSDLDYRSTWYRPDVVEGDMYESDTLDSLRDRYYGSDYLCISEEYVDSILNEGNYDSSIKDAIQNALNSRIVFGKYVYIELRQ